MNGFSSLTLYSGKHFCNPNPLGRCSRGTENITAKRNADGSLTNHAGAISHGVEDESNCMAALKGPFSIYIRASWGQEGHRQRQVAVAGESDVAVRPRIYRVNWHGRLNDRCHKT